MCVPLLSYILHHDQYLHWLNPSSLEESRHKPRLLRMRLTRSIAIILDIVDILDVLRVVRRDAVRPFDAIHNYQG